MTYTLRVITGAETTATIPHPELELDLPPRLPRKRIKRQGRSEAMQSVTEFHSANSLPMARTPQERISSALLDLRINLLQEEVAEFIDAATRIDTIAVADALADIVYVTYGTALSYGIDLDAVLREVHRANMSKLGADGQPFIRADGKVLKGPSYVPPDVRRVLLDQPPLFVDDGF